MDDIEPKALSAISKHFTRSRIKKLVKEFNSNLDEAQRDQDFAEKHTQKSMGTLEKSMANIVEAIEQGSVAVPSLVKRLESLQVEHQALNDERTEIKKDRPLIPRLSEETILEKVRMQKTVIHDTSLSNKDRRRIIRYFVRQLRFYPETGEVIFTFGQTLKEKTTCA